MNWKKIASHALLAFSLSILNIATLHALIRDISPDQTSLVAPSTSRSLLRPALDLAGQGVGLVGQGVVFIGKGMVWAVKNPGKTLMFLLAAQATMVTQVEGAIQPHFICSPEGHCSFSTKPLSITDSTVLSLPAPPNQLCLAQPLAPLFLPAPPNQLLLPAPSAPEDVEGRRVKEQLKAIQHRAKKTQAPPQLSDEGL